MPGVWITQHGVYQTTDALGWTIPSAARPIRVRGGAVDFQKLSEVHSVKAKPVNDRVDVHREAVARQLNPALDPIRDIADEGNCIGCLAQADEVRDNELAVGVDTAPRPGVTITLLTLLTSFLFAADERPNLIDLDAFALQIPHKLVV